MKRFALALALVAGLAVIVVPSAAALRFTDTPCPESGGGGIRVCPAGVVGGSYSITLEGAGGCGPGLPYQYRIINGALPGGLSLSSSGVISGTPTGAGASAFWVELSDQDPPSASWCFPDKAEREFSITIAAGLSINTQSVKPGTVGEAYSETLTAMQITSLNPPAGPQVSATWSVQSGTLPPGVALSSAGALAGTPTAEGTYQFVVLAQNGAQSDTETLTLVVRQPLVIAPLALHWEGLHGSEVGVPLSSTLSATGGTGTFTWSLAGGVLPTGVALGADGTIAGTPKVSGKFPFTVQVSDTEARAATLNATLIVAAKLSFKTLQLKAAKVGKLYKAKLATLGGVNPVKWKILRGTLPRGLHFAKKLGMFVGTPKRKGTYRVTVQVIDGYGIKSQRTFVLVVKA